MQCNHPSSCHPSKIEVEGLNNRIVTGGRTESDAPLPASYGCSDHNGTCLKCGIRMELVYTAFLSNVVVPGKWWNGSSEESAASESKYCQPWTGSKIGTKAGNLQWATCVSTTALMLSAFNCSFAAMRGFTSLVSSAKCKACSERHCRERRKNCCVAFSFLDFTPFPSTFRGPSNQHLPTSGDKGVVERSYLSY
ncbi:hypothetical protein BJ508DRAFT_34890 [Ascobolus immersus RN42]|uniref:Uncharacterized protein n=1 Tax=Ascobolus immersus RN42 TaxID=1160509 RepID=A0A3N4HKU6_ASCIM|nr:hypothetical protein BJ508DRAFT_34890 [Ascobolus immersus RN42]